MLAFFLEKVWVGLDRDLVVRCCWVLFYTEWIRLLVTFLLSIHISCFLPPISSPLSSGYNSDYESFAPWVPGESRQVFRDKDDIPTRLSINENNTPMAETLLRSLQATSAATSSIYAQEKRFYIKLLGFNIIPPKRYSLLAKEPYGLPSLFWPKPNPCVQFFEHFILPNSLDIHFDLYFFPLRIPQACLYPLKYFYQEFDFLSTHNLFSNPFALSHIDSESAEVRLWARNHFRPCPRLGPSFRHSNYALLWDIAHNRF